jgi:large conductance mechanosensitive channel protein
MEVCYFMWKDFKAFAMKGNVIDMSIGVIIGGAFGKIVTSLVSDIIMPILGMITSGINFSSLKLVLKEAEIAPDGKVISPENAINYGNFLDTVLNFLIIAFSIFMIIRLLQEAKNKLVKAQEEETEKAEKKPSVEDLLGEIRDLLKNEANNSEAESQDSLIKNIE